jgi:hypothetical protein
MRVTSVELTPQDSSRNVVFSYKDPDNQNPYNIKGATGLDAEDLFTERYMGFSNAQLMDIFLNPRTVVFLVELNPIFAMKDSFSSLRDEIYKMVWASRKGLIDIIFKEDNVAVAQLSGVVAKIEAAPFTKTPMTQITIVCEKPMLKGPDDINVDTSGFNHSRITVYDKLSSAPHGFNFIVQFTQNATSFTMQNLHDETWMFEVAPSDGFLENDLLICSTEFNSRSLTRTRGAATVPIIDAITAGSIWPIMFPGTNEFALNDFHKIDWELFSYFPTYWGI